VTKARASTELGPKERLAIIASLLLRSGSELESFFRAHDLGAPFRQAGDGAGKERRINDALDAASRRGDADEVLRDAVRHFSLGRHEVTQPIRLDSAQRDKAEPLELARIHRLHPSIQTASGDLLRDGHAGAAVLEAFKAIEVRTKTLSGLHDKSGRDLMAHAFRESSPTLQFNTGASVSDRDEQEGFKLIFMGAMQGIRNPKAHDPFVPLDSDRAFEYLAVASLLMRRLDDVERSSSSTAGD
jgi:uncharacterized protein (TIGR02391 family)